MKKNKLLAVLLALAMTLSLLPTAALAAAATENCANGTSCTTHAAAIGTTHYDTLAEAVAAVPHDVAEATTITLLKSIENISTVEIKSTQKIILELNGQTITAAVRSDNANKHYYAIDNYGTFTLKDSSAEQTGTITARGIENLGNGVMAVESGKIVACDTNGGAAIWNESVLTINGGTLKTTHVGSSSDTVGVGCLNNSGSALITGGSFEGANKRTYAIISTGEIEITPAENKKVNIAGAHGGLAIDSGTAVVNGGSYSSTDYYGLYVSNDGYGADPMKAAVTVNGGTFSGPNYSVWIGSDYNNPVNSTIEINGGTFNKPLNAQKCTRDGAISITGGTFTADPTEYLATGCTAMKDNETNTWTVSDNRVAEVNGQKYATLAAAIAAATDGQTVTLLKDVILTGEMNITEGNSFVLDLNRKTLTGRVNLKKGNMTVQNGKISGGQALNVYGSNEDGTDKANYSVLNVANDVVIDATYGICVFPEDYNNKKYGGYGIVVNIAGTVKGGIFVSGNLGNTPETSDAMSKSANVPVINILDGAKISESGEHQGISMNGYAVVNVNNAEITGCEAIGVKRGVLNVKGGILTATGAKVNPAQANNNGTEATGAAISMTSTYNYAGLIRVNVTDGTIKSKNNAALYVGHSQSDSVVKKYDKGFVVSVTGGSFSGASDVGAVYIADKADGDNENYTKAVLVGGTFSSDPSDYVAANTIVRRNGSSAYTYTVLAKSDLKSGVYLTDPSGALASRYYISSTANGVWTVSYNPPSDSGSTTTTTPSQPSTSTETKPDGSTTTTETKPDGTVTESNTSKPTTDANGNTSQTTTETTTGKDGVTESKTETVTKPDGSASSTTESTTTKPDGTKTESTTETTVNKDGSTASTTTATTTNKDGTVTESKTEATTSTVTNKDGSTTETKQETTTTSTGSKTESTTVTTVNKDGSTTATTTATTTDKAGTVTESKTESTTSKNGTTTEVTVTTETKANGTVIESKTATTTQTNGSSSSTTTATVTKADGTKVESKTTATTSLSTNKTTGTVTETKKETTTTSDGVKSEGTTVTQIRKDGTVTSTETVKASDSTGTTATKTTTLDAKGEVTTTAEVSVSSKAVTEAAKTGVAVTIPVEVTATKSASTAPTVSVSVPKTAESVKVELPVQNVTPGTVAVIVNADGTEEIVKTSIVTEDGVALNVDGNAQIKLVDNSTTFTDVRPVDHWASDEIDFSTSRELFKGTSDTTFTPEGTVTRAMLYTVMARFDDADVVTTGANWYADSLEWAKANNVSDGTNPTGNITREQLATMLYRYVGEPAATGSTDSYADAGSVSDYAAAAMQWAVENGLINGINGRLQPQGYATRAQLAAIMQRFCANVMF